MYAGNWHPHRRESDGEHVGYLVADATAPDVVRAHSLLGHPLGDPGTRAEAMARLDERGLADLAERWWHYMPVSLSGDEPEEHREWAWRPVVIVELSPQQVRVRPENPAPGESAQSRTLHIPVGNLLRRQAP